MTPRLLATSPTLDGIASMINRFWYSESYTVNPVTLAIEHPARTVDGYHVRLYRGRYRFESTN